MASRTGAFTLRSLILPAYLPVAAASGAAGAMIPVLVLRAEQVGASLSLAALLLSLGAVGQILTGLPAGALIERIGVRRALIGGGVGETVALTVAGFTTNVVVLGGALLASGCAVSVLWLARQSYLMDRLPADRMARGMSMLGIALRVGILIGPLLGSVGTVLWPVQGAFVVAVALAMVSTGVVTACVERDGPTPSPSAADPLAAETTAAHVLWNARTALATYGSCGLLLMMVRSLQTVALPLWGAHLGLTSATISLMFAAAGAAELVVVYPAGSVMDRFGRAWTATPMMLLLSGSLLVLPHATTAATVTLVAIVMAIANGLGGGILSTISADSAPVVGRAIYLGGFRILVNVGEAAGPALVGQLITISTIGVAFSTTGLIGLAGTGWVWWWIRQLDLARTRDPAMTRR